jgi:hypothetical protein
MATVRFEFHRIGGLRAAGAGVSASEPIAAAVEVTPTSSQLAEGSRPVMPALPAAAGDPEAYAVVVISDVAVLVKRGVDAASAAFAGAGNLAAAKTDITKLIGADQYWPFPWVPGSAFNVILAA